MHNRFENCITFGTQFEVREEREEREEFEERPFFFGPPLHHRLRRHLRRRRYPFGVW